LTSPRAWTKSCIIIYYGQFCGGFHPKDGLFNNNRAFMIKVGGAFIKAVLHGPVAHPENMKRSVAQAFQPAPGTAGGGCPPYRQNFSEQLLMGRWPTRKA
jgi:hypothetical protein